MQKILVRMTINRISLFFIILVFILIAESLITAAPVVLLEEGKGYYPLGLNLEYLEDKEKKWTIDDVRSQELSKRFQTSTQKTLNFKYSASNIWIRFTLKNTSDIERRILLEHSHPFMNKVNLFIVDQDGVKVSKKSGMLVNKDKLDIIDKNHIFKLDLHPNSEITVYLSFSSTGRMFIPLNIWEYTDFIEKNSVEQILLGIFYGSIIAILLYSLFIFISIREKSYLLYTLYLSFFLIHQLNADGFGYLYLWSDNKWVIQYSAIIGWNMTLFLYLLFSLSFLNTKVIIPKINRLFLIYGSLFIVNILLLPVTGVLQSCKITASLQLAMFFLLMIISIFLMIKRIRLSYYYFVAVCFLMAGTIITNLLALKGGQISYFAKYSIQYGILFEILILAFGLSDRLTTLRKEKESAVQIAIETELKLLKTKEENLNTLRLRKEAEEVNRFKSEFFATVSHELRTPMQSILGWSKLALEKMELLDKKKLKEYFSDIALSGNRLLRLINDLLDISKNENSKLVYTYKKGRLSDFVKLSIQELTVLAEEKHIAIDFSPLEDEALIDLDPFRISQVIGNLIANAIKFSDANSQIQIDINQTKESTEFSIKDSGIGVPDDDKKSIFDKFTQSDMGRSINGGTGLGLVIANLIIEDHDGNIWVEDNENKGSVFKFFIPNKKGFPIDTISH